MKKKFNQLWQQAKQLFNNKNEEEMMDEETLLSLIPEDLDSLLVGNPCYLLKTMPVIHCKRGRDHCEKCREIYAQKISLLDICPENQQARPMIQVEHDGQKIWHEYDVIRRFDSWEEAEAYLDLASISAIIDKNDD